MTYVPAPTEALTAALTWAGVRSAQASSAPAAISDGEVAALATERAPIAISRIRESKVAASSRAMQELYGNACSPAARSPQLRSVQLRGPRSPAAGGEPSLRWA